MPRIRTLKPQFWDSPSTAKADLAPRLLFMAMWNWADDAGRGTANLKELEAFAFPNDDIPRLPRRSSGNSAAQWRNFAELFWETVQVYEVTLYEVNSRRFYEIGSFRIHQSKNFRPDSSLPSPADGHKWDLASEYGLNEPTTEAQPTEVPQVSSGNSAVSCRTSPLDVDRDEDWDRDKQPPYPPNLETAASVVPLKQTGSELARARFGKIQARSAPAHQIAQAFSASLPNPIESGVLSEIAVQIDKCLTDSIPPNAIANGIRDWAASDSWSPTQIPRFVAKATARNAMTVEGKATRKALDYHDAAEQLIAELGIA